MMKRLIMIGAIAGAVGVIFRGFTSWKSAFIEWLVCILAAVLVGKMTKDYIDSESVYEAIVGSAGFLGIYFMKGLEKVGKEFAENPFGFLHKARGKKDDK